MGAEEKPWPLELEQLADALEAEAKRFRARAWEMGKALATEWDPEIAAGDDRQVREHYDYVEIELENAVRREQAARLLRGMVSVEVLEV